MDDVTLDKARKLREEIRSLEQLLNECTTTLSMITDWQTVFPPEMLQRHRAEMLEWARTRYVELKAKFAAL